jgi:hypothetical protein
MYGSLRPLLNNATFAHVARTASAPTFAQVVRTVNALATSAVTPVADGGTDEAEALTEALLARVRALPAEQRIGLAGAVVTIARESTDLISRVQSTGASPMATFALLQVAVALWYVALVLGLLSDE